MRAARKFKVQVPATDPGTGRDISPACRRHLIRFRPLRRRPVPKLANEAVQLSPPTKPKLPARH